MIKNQNPPQVINKKKKKEYVNNADFCQTLVEYKSLKKNKPDAKIPNYIGDCIQRICNNLSHNPNFIGYTFREDMVGDAIENCIMAIKNFDTAKTENPFGYFTQIAWFAFLRRIAKEKKQLYLKYKNIQMMALTLDNNNELHISNDEYSNDIISSFEKKLTKSTKKSKIQNIESLIEGGDVPVEEILKEIIVLEE
jgi:hypothetical protein